MQPWKRIKTSEAVCLFYSDTYLPETGPKNGMCRFFFHHGDMDSVTGTNKMGPDHGLTPRSRAEKKKNIKALVAASNIDYAGSPLKGSSVARKLGERMDGEAN